MANISIVTIGAALFLSAMAGPAMALDLYDGEAGTTPDAQGWLAYGDNSLSQNYNSTSGGQTQLNTTGSNSIQAGYSNHTIFGTIVNPAFPVLDRLNGFTLSFTVRSTGEAHDSLHRAGFSVIALGSDKQGIELGFWGDEVFAQNGGTSPTLFTRGESAGHVPPADYLDYDLIVGASAYELKANGASVLTGPIRDYSAFVPSIGPDPYEIANYIFLGDNTTSARADTSIAYVGVTALPEPAFMSLAAVVGLLALRRRR